MDICGEGGEDGAGVVGAYFVYGASVRHHDQRTLAPNEFVGGGVVGAASWERRSHVGGEEEEEKGVEEDVEEGEEEGTEMGEEGEGKVWKAKRTLRKLVFLSLR